MDNESELVFTNKGSKSLKAGFALIACAGAIMLATMAATLFVDVGEGWSTALGIVYLAAGIAGIILIAYGFGTAKRATDTAETESRISERETR